MNHFAKNIISIFAICLTLPSHAESIASQNLRALKSEERFTQSEPSESEDIFKTQTTDSQEAARQEKKLATTLFFGLTTSKNPSTKATIGTPFALVYAAPNADWKIKFSGNGYVSKWPKAGASVSGIADFKLTYSWSINPDLQLVATSTLATGSQVSHQSSTKSLMLVRDMKIGSEILLSLTPSLTFTHRTSAIPESTEYGLIAEFSKNMTQNTSFIFAPEIIKATAEKVSKFIYLAIENKITKNSKIETGSYSSLTAPHNPVWSFRLTHKF